MVPGVLLGDVIQAGGTKQVQPGSQTVPYFSLNKYSDDISKLGQGAHPMRTLIQARFALVDKRRDMQQAVCCLSNSEPDVCFHISQIWYVIVGDCKSPQQKLRICFDRYSPARHMCTFTNLCFTRRQSTVLNNLFTGAVQGRGPKTSHLFWISRTLGFPPRRLSDLVRK